MDNEQGKAEIQFAKDFATKFGYNQIVIIGRRVDDPLRPGGEWVTTYGTDAAHTAIAKAIGEFIVRKVMRRGRQH